MTSTTAITTANKVTGGSAVQTKSHSHQSKDGSWYPSYMEKVNANIAYNEAYLKSKELLQTVEQMKKQQRRRQPASSKTKRTATPRIVTPVRRSTRISTKDDPSARRKTKFQALDFGADDVPRFKRRSSDVVVPTPPPKKKKKTSKQAVSYVYNLSDQEVQALQQLDPETDWLEDMDYWLRTIPHGNGHKPVSSDNARSVMGQVHKLATGEGITYKHWRKNVSFKKGTRIHLGQNMEDLYQEAQDMEDRHGRDKGNGWLLKHPIMKLRLYQEFRLLNLKKK